MPMFSGWGYMIRLLWELFDVWISENSKMAACNRKQISYNAYLSLYIRQERIANGRTHVFGVRQLDQSSPQPENMGIAVGNSLLSCIRAELYVNVYFRLTAAIFYFRHTQTSDSVTTILSVLPDRENMGIVHGISLLQCIEAEIQVSFISTSG